MPLALPTASFAKLRADVLECLSILGAPGDLPIKSVSIDLGDSREPITIPIFVAPQLDSFSPAPLQIRMIQYLARGAKTATQMKASTKGRMYETPGGIGQLIELGIVEKRFTKYRLTAKIGKEIAADIGDDEAEDE